MTIRFRDPMAEDFEDWLLLWKGYLTFYEADIADNVTAMTWSRILDPMSSVKMRLAIRNLDVAGFAIHHVHASTWSIKPIIYLEDLFVNPEFRGEGIGSMLIEDLISLCENTGIGELYWQTKQSNTTARSIYDRYSKANEFVTYRVAISQT